MSDEREWRVIPEFPKYEMTFDGDIRTVSSKSPITYRQLDEDSGMTIVLFREGGLVEKDIRGLIYSTFPEFKRVSPEARLELIKSFADHMSRWLGGEAFVYEDFEQLAEIVIEEGWRPND